MKLYFSPGTCALAPHIVLHELELPFTLERVDLKNKVLTDGTDYKAINPKGSVPTLELDDGQRLTEGPAILQYLADRRPEAKLVPPWGTIERYRLQEWLNYITAELHKQFSNFFNKRAPEEWKQVVKETIATKYDFVASRLEGGYLMGKQFTVADAYAFTVMRWSKPNGIDLARWPAIEEYFARVAARPAVQKAMEEQGLVK